MEARVVAAGKGWQWIVDGFALFLKSPGMWIVLTIVLVVISFLVSYAIPLLGPLLVTLFWQVLFAGWMIGCRAVDNGEDLELGHLFAGFKQHAVPLVTIGGVYLVGTIIVFGIVFVVAGGSTLMATMTKPGVDMETLAIALRSFALALAVGAAAYIPFMMLIWFAPPLVALNGLAPVEAMKLSFAACLKNVLPFLIYGVLLMVLWFIASIPLFLGLIVLLPVFFCSVYASYKDVFADGAAAAGGDPLPR